MDNAPDLRLLKELLNSCESYYPPVAENSCICTPSTGECHHFYTGSKGHCLTCETHLVFLVQLCYHLNLKFELQRVVDVFPILLKDFKECQSTCKQSYCLKHFALFTHTLTLVLKQTNTFGFDKLKANVAFLTALSTIFYCFTYELKNCKTRHFIPKTKGVKSRLCHYRNLLDNWME